ncbi:MAG: RdgB/HAM1 family non-canonical purine NTP pyrophosphatase [Prevotellaceae bacterium]|jgi:XTP/dITP diphosphohydrolase|nr:RdgB/HAM1 family non-canonical purine NTP pyrophosphatase [Prevotellaceae bacterium]
MNLIFATNNPHKLEEVSTMLSKSMVLSTPRRQGVTEDIPEDQATLEGNALQKVRYIHERLHENCFADDTGLEVEALNGAPGVHSARYAGEAKNMQENMQKLLCDMKDADNRNARFRTVIALILDGKEYLFEGEVKGEIMRSMAGCKGFGYDPVFRPSGYDITFAEMEPAEKNKISHRGKAIRLLVNFLNQWAG